MKGDLDQKKKKATEILKCLYRSSQEDNKMKKEYLKIKRLKFSRLLEKYQNWDLNVSVLDLNADVFQKVWHIPSQMSKKKFKPWHIKVKLKSTKENQKILKKKKKFWKKKDQLSNILKNIRQLSSSSLLAFRQYERKESQSKVSKH